MPCGWGLYEGIWFSFPKLLSDLNQVFLILLYCFLSCQMQPVLLEIINFMRLKTLILLLVLTYYKKIQNLGQAVAMSSYIVGLKQHGLNLFWGTEEHKTRYNTQAKQACLGRVILMLLHSAWTCLGKGLWFLPQDRQKKFYLQGSTQTKHGHAKIFYFLTPPTTIHLH